MVRGVEVRPVEDVRRDASPPTARGWFGLIGNPHSGRGRATDLAGRLRQELSRRGLESRAAWTPEQRRELVAEAVPAAGCLGLVAMGGDGTVAELVNECPVVPIAVLPTGTENLFARHFGFERDPARLVERLVAGRTRRIDLGRAAGRRFALMAGFGFDAEVVSDHHRRRMARPGVATTSRAAYVEPVLRSSVRYRFPEVRVWAETDAGTEALAGTSVLVFNLPRYALGLPFAPSARDDDGWLDLVVFRDPGPLQALRYLWLVFRRLHLRRPGVEHRRIRRARVEAVEPVPVQLDGDPAGRVGSGEAGGWLVEVEPLALTVFGGSSGSAGCPA
ncbi:MAG: protein BmrU [Isosphaeraceae bacterium]|jgi:diacylglycerol kinase family enzyme|nr:MAG: protein BmrU [Isosphaeraceae bacterium]